MENFTSNEHIREENREAPAATTGELLGKQRTI
jgi:hypothetical protein